MKKLLIFMLVLGMASLANATLQISVNGVMEPADTTINLLPSETVSLDIWTDAAIDSTPASWHLLWAMVVDVTVGTIGPPLYGGGVILSPYNTDPGYALYSMASASGQMPEGAGSDGVWGAATRSSVSAPALAVIFDEIIFHCEAEGDATISIYSLASDGVTWNFQDAVTIHQIPEPMTVMLLGLGGLFLRRRR